MRKSKYIVTIPKDYLNVDILGVLQNKSIIKEYLVVLHDKDTLKPHFHILIELYRGLDQSTVRRWFKTFKRWVSVYSGETSDLTAYLLYETHCSKVIGSKNEKKAL